MPQNPTLAPDTTRVALDRDAAALQAAVAELVRVYQFRDRDRICCHDISVTQCYALETLVEHGPMRLSALAERLFLDKSTTSRVVGALVKKGYVEQHATSRTGGRRRSRRPSAAAACARASPTTWSISRSSCCRISTPRCAAGSCGSSAGSPAPPTRASVRASRSGRVEVAARPARTPAGAADFFGLIVVSDKSRSASCQSRGFRSSSSAPARSAWPPPPTRLAAADAARARGRPADWRRHPPMGACPHVLAVEVQRRSSGSGDPRAATAGRCRLATTTRPATSCVDRYLEPLAASRELAPHIRLNTR